MVRDPICGMVVDEKDPRVLRVESKGSDYWFCSEGCRTKFLATRGRE